jgi:hypothetical protein
LYAFKEEAMQRLRLADWASIAEIVGTVAVVVSLLIVAYSLERNTTALSGQFLNEMYDANREIGQILLLNPELVSIIDRGQADVSDLTPSEILQYKQYLALNLDIWERAITRENEGLIDERSVEGWHEYHHEFFRRSLTKKIWKEMRWQWKNPELHQRVDAAVIRD